MTEEGTIASEPAPPESAADPAADSSAGNRPRIGLQELVQTLSRFWAGEGALLLPACDFEITEGVFHPDAFFPFVGSDSWRAAFTQPLRRPLDGCGGEHPFRLVRPLHFLAFLKPPPADLQSILWRSLAEAGIELRQHDVRQLEWQWESTPLDGWGAGWQTVIDGLAVARVTFIQQLAGRPLAPPGVEIRYHLERLLLVIAGEGSVADLAWRGAGGPGYAALRQRDEVERSQYAREVADAGLWRGHLRDLAAEAGRCLDAGLARPAYELAVKGVHVVDLLTARDELAAGERQEVLEQIAECVAAAAILHLTAPKPKGKKARARRPKKAASKGRGKRGK